MVYWRSESPQDVAACDTQRFQVFTLTPKSNLSSLQVKHKVFLMLLENSILHGWGFCGFFKIKNLFNTLIDKISYWLFTTRNARFVTNILSANCHC